MLPGLLDLHVHSYGNLSPSGVETLGTEGAARRMLYAGVTGFLDLFADEDAIFALRDRQRAATGPERRDAADVHAAGPLLTAPGGYGTQMGLPTRTVATPDEARRVVAALSERRPDVVKLAYTTETGSFASMDRLTMEAVVETARALDLRTVVHVDSWASVVDVARAGASAVTHLPPAPVPDAAVEAMRAHGTVAIPALAGELGLSDLTTRSWRDAPLLAAVASPSVVAGYSAPPGPGLESTVLGQREERAARLAAVRALHRAGVPVLAGTDAGALGTVQGFSLHHELALLVEAGLTPREAVAAATTEAGAFLGRRVGLRVGDRADLVVLAASPLDDVRRTQDVELVVSHGRVVDREALLGPLPAEPLTGPLVDDFASDTLTSALGTAWRVVTDEALGGTSAAEVSVSGGVLRVEASLRPGSAGIGFVELVLPLDAAGAMRDVSGWDGVRLRLRALSGPLALKLQTADVGNVDYHAVVLEPSATAQELTLPFSGFRQLWSEQVPWTGRRVLAVALSSGGMEAAEVAYEVEAVEWYRDDQ
ncbi:CIA30 family protein [Rubrivirga marina]|uniref:Amidohydrolase-related domain-containing protein n=1 Tax=Rubrivirga marina TaxID=1196024 RepID=A0A271J2R3_9BACT|nr:CIA30 family protein [Rubrivirga marina]PAP77255.1 hypothetical protein BSZ37_12835 [Rubrivirga marina]